MSTSKMSFTLLDASNEKSTVAFNIAPITTLTLEGHRQNSNPATNGSLAAAIAAISLCNMVKSQLTVDPILAAEEVPAEKYAQREIGLLVQMQDATNFKKFHATIPGVAWELVGLGSSDMVDTTAAEWTALVSAIESGTKSPDGNAVVVLGGSLVGRRS